MTTETLKQFLSDIENIPIVVEVEYCGHTCEMTPAQLELQPTKNKYAKNKKNWLSNARALVLNFSSARLLYIKKLNMDNNSFYNALGRIQASAGVIASIEVELATHKINKDLDVL